MIVARSYLLRPFLLSLVVVATLSAKVVHLFLHVHSVPLASFLLYFPTFFIQDCLLFLGTWFLLHKTSGVAGTLGLLIAGFLGIVTLVAASAQIGFFYVTGSEIQWGTATSVANDPAGMKLLLSGLWPVLAAGVVIVLLAWFSTPFISTWIGRRLSAIANISIPDESGEYLPVAQSKQPSHEGRTARFWAVGIALTAICLRLVRPPVPYNHMSGTIPFTLLNAFRSKPEVCPQAEAQPFPLPELIEKKFWELPRGHFKGWTPGIEDIADEEDFNGRPQWLPEELPPGFGRWALEKPANQSVSGERGSKACPSAEAIKNTYNPAKDPLRITNLDLDLLEPLQEALRDHDIPIAHIFLIEMESARKDVFPLKYGSHLHKMILQSHETEDTEVIDNINSKLSAVSPIAEQLTGESGGFPQENLSADLWQDSAAPGMGGINVLGAVTASSLSFKSVLGSHCGVGPLSLDFMYENEAEIYQPCIMHILELFNRLKEGSGKESSDMRQRRWKSVFAQSITGVYDDQNKLNRKMGFDKSIVKEDIDFPKAKHFHQGMEEINYFGYPEEEVLPYLQDTVNEALEKGERLFFSHFTSTTHHPWAVPSDFETEQYWADDGLVSKHEEANRYLNTVRYVDQWLGKILNVIDEAGIANETLVVFVGDHGQAFREDARYSGTYQNGHISNFRIPLIFRHPLLPRIQLSANATSLSILPTILDLLINTDSLNAQDKEAASDLINEYEGQSLIRPYKASHNGRQAWNIGVINAGGSMLSVASAAVPYRLILPLRDEFTYVFSDLKEDPDEIDLIEEWDMDSLVRSVRRAHGAEAASWVVDAEKVGRWWVEEKKRLWNYRE